MIELPENLIQALRAGEDEAYEQLYALYYEQVYALAYGILQNAPDAQDAVQQTFFRVFRKLPTLKKDAAFPTWLMKLASNEALMLLRSRKPEAPFEEYFEDILDGEGELTLPEAALEQRENADRLNRIISQLSPQQRQTLVLYYFHELKTSEIAEVMDCSENTVKSRLRYARRHIRSEWEKQERGKNRKLNGVMLPFGEALSRLWLKDTQNTRRKKRIWRKLKVFLRHRNDPGYFASKAENRRAFRIAAGVAAGFVAVMLASATAADVAADSEEHEWVYAPAEQGSWERERQDHAQETVYTAPEYIAEERVESGNYGYGDVSYFYEPDDTAGAEESGLNNRYENAQVTPTQPSTEPATQPSTEPPEEPPAPEPTQSPFEPSAQEPTQRQMTTEEILSEIEGKYSMGESEGYEITVSDGSLTAYSRSERFTVGPIRFISAEPVADGVYRFELEKQPQYEDMFGFWSGYYYRKGTSVSYLPRDLDDWMYNIGYWRFQIRYSVDDYTMQKDALLLTAPLDEGYAYQYHYRSD